MCHKNDTQGPIKREMKKGGECSWSNSKIRDFYQPGEYLLFFEKN